jgi:ABC-type sulfate/molybdate transport systems ATPase subunit
MVASKDCRASESAPEILLLDERDARPQGDLDNELAGALGTASSTD